eukprot:TRINITY_DN346_c0_g1_i1.p1 TRINITY_DN346_c0_g1~~TRINITY_DN346_c0_g1_i1.p1  ORF type:complete len:497 (-),score=46.73 TRINITY_DN346_c0_g1_i1:1036-2526(-)
MTNALSLKNSSRIVGLWVVNVDPLTRGNAKAMLRLPFARLSAVTQSASSQLRTVATGSSGLYERLKEIVPAKVAEVKEIRKTSGDLVLGSTTVEMAYGGMRGIKGLLCETSALDADEGIRFRSLTIPECQQRLPAYKAGGEPQPEGLLWLLLTGEIPSKTQVDGLTAELRKRETVSREVLDVLRAVPKSTHPMTQLTIGLMALQSGSKFHAAYHAGQLTKNNMWEAALDDTLDIAAKLPIIASTIYNNVYHNGRVIAADKSLDWSGNYAHMIGFDDKNFHELMRLYLTIHSDHEGGNVSAHTTHLVGSALSDPYLSYAAGLNGLAGPLHGLANQEVLGWLIKLTQNLPTWSTATKQDLEQYVWKTLNEGQVVPGYGHAVLRKTDPRYSCQREFALKYLPNDPMFQLVSKLYEVVPDVLTKHGKTKNPWPNVDAHSGVLLQYYNLKEHDYYTVMFGVSRALGALSSLVWDRALGLPIERPKSVTTEWIKSQIAKQKA